MGWWRFEIFSENNLFMNYLQISMDNIALFHIIGKATNNFLIEYLKNRYNKLKKD